MTKEDFVAYIHKKAELETKATAEATFDAIVDSMTETLAEGEPVAIRNFGTFTVVSRAPRRGRNPQTGEALDIPASKTVKFSPGAELQAAAKAAYTGDWQDWLDYRVFMRAMRDQLNDLKTSLDEFSRRAKRAPEGESYWEETRVKLRERYEDTRRRLTEMSSHSGSAWKELKHGVEKAYGELRDGLRRAWANFK
jgi:DNA-binding protein HU-beta